MFLLLGLVAGVRFLLPAPVARFRVLLLGAVAGVSALGVGYCCPPCGRFLLSALVAGFGVLLLEVVVGVSALCIGCRCPPCGRFLLPGSVAGVRVPINALPFVSHLSDGLFHRFW